MRGDFLQKSPIPHSQKAKANFLINLLLGPLDFLKNSENSLRNGEKHG
jgi:hypothetical protein